MANQHPGKEWVKGPRLQLQSRSWKQPVHIGAKQCKTPGEKPLEIKERPILQLLWVRDKKYQEWGKGQKMKGKTKNYLNFKEQNQCNKCIVHQSVYEAKHQYRTASQWQSSGMYRP